MATASSPSSSSPTHFFATSLGRLNTKYISGLAQNLAPMIMQTFSPVSGYASPSPRSLRGISGMCELSLSESKGDLIGVDKLMHKNRTLVPAKEAGCIFTEHMPSMLPDIGPSLEKITERLIFYKLNDKQLLDIHRAVGDMCRVIYYNHSTLEAPQGSEAPIPPTDDKESAEYKAYLLSPEYLAYKKKNDERRKRFLNIQSIAADWMAKIIGPEKMESVNKEIWEIRNKNKREKIKNAPAMETALEFTDHVFNKAEKELKECFEASTRLRSGYTPTASGTATPSSGLSTPESGTLSPSSPSSRIGSSDEEKSKE